MTTAPRSRARELAFLAGVWVVALALDVEKAVHVDDAAHLLIAEHIARDPLHPMSGVVSWGDHPEPIHALNSPHGFFYLLALARALGGGSLLGPHLCMAAFAALAIACFHRLARRVATPERALAWTALVFVGPGFLPSQNLMTDVPLLALGLAMLCALDEDEKDAAGRRRLRGALVAGLIVGLACLVKYTALAWLPLFLVEARARRDARVLFGLAPPLLLLTAYAAFNVADYGGVHVLERPLGSEGERTVLGSAGLALGRGALFVMTLGAISPHVLAWTPRLRARDVALGSGLVALLTGGAQLLARQGPEEMRDEPLVVSVLRAIFFVAGLAALSLGLRRGDTAPDARTTRLRAYALFTALFVVALAPFVAVRHALLVLPALVLGAAPHAPPAPSRALVVSVLVSAVLGSLLGISDARLASAYREAAARWRDISVTSPAPSEGPDRHPYYAGHWGWQWYATEAGLRPYEPGGTRLEPGDLIIRPRLPDPPELAPEDARRCPVARTTVLYAGWLDVLRTVTPRQGFYSVWQGLPWTPTEEPLDHLDVLVCR